MIVATYRKSCSCRAGAHPGRVQLENLRMTTAMVQGVASDVPVVDLVLDPGPSCDSCLREWEEVKS